MFNKWMFVLFCLSLLISCNSDVHFEEQTKIPDYNWHYTNKAEFVVSITDTTKRYDIYVNVEHSKEYTYRNMYVLIQTVFPSGKKLEQRIRLDLADKTGKWRGKCGRNKCMAQFPIQERAFFNEIGNYSFILEQNMRVNPLEGVTSVGIGLYKSSLPQQ